ncbi:hypothetical protein ACC738_39310, partial [Rhizobium ruizarguesonis]
IQMLAEEEYRRLLYVAMTRAADRLVVCGYRGVRVNNDTWHMMISTARHAPFDALPFPIGTGERGRLDMRMVVAQR